MKFPIAFYKKSNWECVHYFAHFRVFDTYRFFLMVKKIRLSCKQRLAIKKRGRVDDDADSEVQEVKRMCCPPCFDFGRKQSGCTIADPIVILDDEESDAWNAAVAFMDAHVPYLEKLNIVRKSLDLAPMLISQRHFQQKRNAMQCMLYSLWNALGDDSVLSVGDMGKQVKAMNQREWRPYVTRELAATLEETGETVVAKKQGKALVKELSVGGLKGRWSMLVLYQALVKHTNLRLRRVSPRVKRAGYVDMDFSRKCIDSHACVFVVTQFEVKNKTEGHVVVVKHGQVYDCDEKLPFPVADYVEYEYIIALYVLEVNPLV